MLMSLRTAMCVILPLAFLCSCSANDGESIVIIKWASHPALDELEEGVIQRLVDELDRQPELGLIRIERHNANGDLSTARSLATAANRADVVAVVSIATPASQAVANAVNEIPVIYGAVADPEGAGLLARPNVSGIQNAGQAIMSQAVVFAVNLVRELRPDTMVDSVIIGTLYNPAEQNSARVQQWLAAAANQVGHIRLIQRHVSVPTEVSIQAADIAESVDVLYSANDNTVNRAASALAAVATSSSKPFIIGDLSTIDAGAAAAVGLEYRSMGADVAEMVIEAITNGTIPNHRPPPTAKVWLSASVLAEMGHPVSAQLRSIVDSVVH